MPAKTIAFEADTRDHAKTGIIKAANAVKHTLGPRGNTVVIDRSWGAPNITKDGSSVIDDIEFENQFEDMAAKLLKEAASKTSDAAGDGTTTSVVLAEAMFLSALRFLAHGANAIAISRGIKKCADAVDKWIQEKAVKIKDLKKDRNRIVELATVACGNKEIGEFLAEAFQKAGKDGAVTIDESKTKDTEVKIVEGMQFDRGYLSPHFVTDEKTGDCVLKNARILIWEDKISSAQKLVPLLEAVANEKIELLIIAEDVEGDALATLVVNRVRGVVKCCAVKAPGYGDRRKEMLQDIAVVTGGKCFFKDEGMDLEKVTINQLGRAAKVIIDPDYCTIIEGAGSKRSIEDRIAQIRRDLEKADSDYDREKLQERLSRLSGGVAQINVGAATETEMKSKKKLVENALATVRGALEEGYVPGGGVIFIRALEALKKVRLDEDENFARKIFETALLAPARQIAQNAGANPSLTVKKIQDGDFWFGYDAVAGEFCNLKERGIIDSAKVVRHALLNAASVANMLTTSEAMVAEVKDKKEQFPKTGV